MVKLSIWQDAVATIGCIIARLKKQGIIDNFCELCLSNGGFVRFKGIYALCCLSKEV